jgi:hypothetical protein
MRGPGLCTALFLMVAACSGRELVQSADAGVDLAMAPVDFAVAPPDFALPRRAPTDHPPLPVVSNHGGAIVAHPQVWTIVWKGDEDLGAAVDRFYAWMLVSDYWTSSLGEYGVGAGGSNGVIVLPGAAPATLQADALETTLAQLAAQPAYAPQAGTVYSFVIPATTTLVESDGTQVCSFGDGYHLSTAAGLHYAVNLQCGGGADELHIVLSHELAELSTDAEPLANTAWLSDDPPGEIGDLCVGVNVTYDPMDDFGTEHYVVTRLWSARAAATGMSDPCVPAPTTPWFGAAISPSSINVTLDPSGKGSALAAVEPFAYGPVGKIHWQLYSQTGLTFSPSQGVNQAGDTIAIHIAVDGAFQAQPIPLFLFATDAAGDTSVWNFSVNPQ